MHELMEKQHVCGSIAVMISGLRPHTNATIHPHNTAILLEKGAAKGASTTCTS